MFLSHGSLHSGRESLRCTVGACWCGDWFVCCVCYPGVGFVLYVCVFVSLYVACWCIWVLFVCWSVGVLAGLCVGLLFVVRVCLCVSVCGFVSLCVAVLAFGMLLLACVKVRECVLVW